MKLLKHPNDPAGAPAYYKLEWQAGSQRYWLRGMQGELRACPQDWAQKMAAKEEQDKNDRKKS